MNVQTQTFETILHIIQNMLICYRVYFLKKHYDPLYGDNYGNLSVILNVPY